MFNHIMLSVIDIKASKRFYDVALGALDIEAGIMDTDVRCSFRTPTGVFMIKVPLDGEPATHGNGNTIGFAAKSSAQLDAKPMVLPIAAQPAETYQGCMAQASTSRIQQTRQATSCVRHIELGEARAQLFSRPSQALTD